MCSAPWSSIEEAGVAGTGWLGGEWGARWAGNSIGWVTRKNVDFTLTALGSHERLRAGKGHDLLFHVVDKIHQRTT